MREELGFENPFVFRFYKIMRKKWSYPLLRKLDPFRNYSFEEMVSLTKRRINRTILSDIIKSWIFLGIMKKNNTKYTLTNKGMEIREAMLSIEKHF
ncbi:MAG: hypothetical protein ACQESF_05275 [Nanobdellota archaeon]